MPRCYIALGGNVGPVPETFEHALTELDRRPGIQVVQASPHFRSPPVGERAGGEFRNAAAELAADVSPVELLDALQELEHQFGRVREHRWGPRTLDLDLIFYGSEIIDIPRLRVPHPACWYRRFVLDPLAAIAPAFIHPEKQVSVASLRERLLVRPLTFGLAGGDDAEAAQLLSRLAAELPQVRWISWSHGGEPEPAVIAWLGNSEGPGRSGFERLPLVPRLDASGIDASERFAFLRDVAASALADVSL